MKAPQPSFSRATSARPRRPAGWRCLRQRLSAHACRSSSCSRPNAPTTLAPFGCLCLLAASGWRMSGAGCGQIRVWQCQPELPLFLVAGSVFPQTSGGGAQRRFVGPQTAWPMETPRTRPSSRPPWGTCAPVHEADTRLRAPWHGPAPHTART